MSSDKDNPTKLEEEEITREQGDNIEKILLKKKCSLKLSSRYVL